MRHAIYGYYFGRRACFVCFDQPVVGTFYVPCDLRILRELVRACVFFVGQPVF